MIFFQSTGQDGCSFCLVESVFQVISTSYIYNVYVECIYYITQTLAIGGMCLVYYTDSTITTASMLP